MLSPLRLPAVAIGSNLALQVIKKWWSKNALKLKSKNASYLPRVPETDCQINVFSFKKNKLKKKNLKRVPFYYSKNYTQMIYKMDLADIDSSTNWFKYKTLHF